MVAQGIHAASWRSGQNFVAVNVAAIPEELMEAEFFGVAPGAYTGASPKGRIGKMVLANNGTLFLDEIGDMPMRMQVKLLRALQEREIEPVGTNAVIRLNLRVIAASSLDLAQLVEHGRFRADLFYRLSVVPISIPPLRDRLDDLPALTKILLTNVCGSLGISGKELAPLALERLQGYNWPGNVRELRNVLERACIVAGLSSTIRGEHILLGTATHVLASGSGASATGELQAAVSDVERVALNDALQKARGNKAAAARALGIGRSTLYSKLKQLGIT
jgi:transcriptional regulator with PAS, ATPase and Fis domain